MKVVIRPHTPKEEFSYLSYVTNKLPFYKENNYNLSLPKHPDLRKAFDSENSDLFDFFAKEEYKAEFFTQGVAHLESKRDLIEKCLERLQKYKELWEFKTFEEYNICLTKYGPGGSYGSKIGKVTMLTRRNGSFIREAAEDTVVHEIVHIGIQGCIVKKYSLTHWEKEAVVDLFVQILFGDLLVDYKTPNRANPLRDYIPDIKSLDNLPSAIENFITDFPRKN